MGDLTPGGDDVLDHQDPLPFDGAPLGQLGRAIAFGLLADEHGGDDVAA
jgi:hypothetical protein